MANKGIVRQVIDIQAQANRLVSYGGNMPEIEAFAQYNESIKTYLLEHIEDEFLLKYIRTIPSLDLDTIQTKSNIITILLGLFMGASSSIYHEKQKINAALKEIKQISHKYAGYQVMIQNYFSN